VVLAVDVHNFSQQVAGMATRLSRLLDDANVSPALTPDITVNTFKELGVATEELQVAMEELQQQNEELSSALESAAEERRRYQELFQFAPHAYLVTTLEGKIQEANWMAAQLIGVPVQFLIGKPLFVFIDKVDRSLYWLELNRRQHRDYFQEWEFCLRPRDQETIQVACSTIAIRDRNEQPVGFRWVLRDTTEQKRLERLEHSGYGFSGENEALLLQNRPIREYSQGESISLDSQALCYVTQGVVKLSSLTLQNKEMMTGLIKPGMLFGAYLTALPIYQATALSPVELVHISLNEIAASPALAQIMFVKASQRLRQAEILLMIQGEQSIENGLCELLQFLKTEIGESVEQGVRLTVRLTHEDLANACGSTRATITRLLGKLERQGKIRFDEKWYIILTTESR
jgi:PAS domain S-box-containing protein